MNVLIDVFVPQTTDIETVAPTVDLTPDQGARVILVPSPGPPGPQGPSGVGAAQQVTVTGTAATALSGHQAVTRLSDGTIGYASNLDLTHLHLPIWITTGAAASGAQVTAVAFGEIVEPTWAWTPGPVWLGSNGALTQTVPAAPAFLAQLGVSTDPDRLFVDRQPSITLT